MVCALWISYSHPFWNSIVYISYWMKENKFHFSHTKDITLETVSNNRRFTAHRESRSLPEIKYCNSWMRKINFLPRSNLSSVEWEVSCRGSRLSPSFSLSSLPAGMAPSPSGFASLVPPLLLFPFYCVCIKTRNNIWGGVERRCFSNRWMTKGKRKDEGRYLKTIWI